MATSRKPLVLALLVLTAVVAASSDRAGAAGETPAPQKRPGSSSPKISAALATRLRAAGLDPADPQLGQKLRQRLDVSRQTLLRRSGLVTKPLPPAQNAKGTRSPSQVMRFSDGLLKARPVTPVGTSLSIDEASLYYDELDAMLKVTAPKVYKASDIAYRATEPICGLDASGPMESWMGSTWPCCLFDHQGVESMNLKAVISKPFALGAKPRDVTVAFSSPGLPSATRVFPGIHGYNDQVFVILTIDALPPHVPSNGFGIQEKDCHLGGSGARASTGEPWLPTGGEDTLALGVNLGAAYKVTETKITAAHSQLDVPDYTAPEDAFRYARIKTPPAGNRITTVVDWMYGPGDSLTYTIQWTLVGPAGQRPLMTIPLGGPCDS